MIQSFGQSNHLVNPIIWSIQSFGQSNHLVNPIIWSIQSFGQYIIKYPDNDNYIYSSYISDDVDEYIHRAMLFFREEEVVAVYRKIMGLYLSEHQK